MEAKIIKSLIVLGVPGVALGVFYLLLKSFNFNFGEINGTLSALIAILFLLIVGGVTIYALYKWAPKDKVSESVTISEESQNQTKILEGFVEFLEHLVEKNKKEFKELKIKSGLNDSPLPAVIDKSEKEKLIGWVNNLDDELLMLALGVCRV